MSDDHESLELTLDEVMLLVGKGDFSFGKSLFEQDPSLKSFSLAFQLIGVLQKRTLMNSAAKYIAELGGIFNLMQHIKYGFENPVWLNAAVTALLGLKGKSITSESFSLELEKQSNAYSQSGTLRISLFDIAPWLTNPPPGFLQSSTSLDHEIQSEGEFANGELQEILVRKENTLLMKDLRFLELFSESSPPWEEIRSIMKTNNTSKRLKTLESVKGYSKATRSDLAIHKIVLSKLNSRLVKMNAIKPLIYDYQQLEKHAKKPQNLWLWGWSSHDSWGYSYDEVDLLLLRIKFEIGKILPNYPLSLSAEEYEYKCLNMLSDSGKDAKRTLRSKIYYDLFMFLDAQSGSDSIDYFIECVNLTASYANRRQFKMRVNSLVEGLKRLENYQAYSKCEDWIKQHYGEEFFLNLEDI